MKSHFTLSHGVAMACAVSGATAMLNGDCSAQTLTAADYATNSAYADGWQEGDNGGFGFSAWSMYGTYTNAIQHTMDSSSPYNQLGLAWTLFLPNGKPAGAGGADCPINEDSSNPPEAGSDLSRAGRGFPALQVGQTISTVIDNPTERHFYNGYTINFITGGQCAGFYGGCTGVSRLRVGTFEYFTCGRWYVDSVEGGSVSLLDTNTAAAGMRLDVTLTGKNNYKLVMTPLDNPANAYTNAGTLSGAGPIDWIQFEHYNTDSDFYNLNGTNVVSEVAPSPQATDFYIRSITITTNQPVPGPEFTMQPVSSVFYASRTAHFSVSATGYPLIYQWRKDGTNLANGGNISGALTDTLIINNAGAGDLGAYTVVVTNPVFAKAITSAPPANLTLVQPTATPYESAVLAANPVAYWRLNEIANPTNGPPAYDYAGGYAGTYGTSAQNGFNSIAGPQPTDFPGFETNNPALGPTGAGNSWVTVPALNLNTNTATFTMWIYPNGDQSDYTGLFFTRDGTAAGIGYTTGGQLGYHWNNGEYATYSYASGLVIPAGQWSFVAMVIEPTKATFYLYNADGQSSANNTNSHGAEYWAGEARIGGDPKSSGRTFDGKIDEVAVFNYALTPPQVQNLYNTATRVTLRIQRVGANVVLSWPQGTLQSAPNVTGTYTNVTGVSSPYTNTPAGNQKFYRVHVP